MAKSTPPTSSASKEQALEKPKRFCSRCGRELVYSTRPPIPKYDVKTGELTNTQYVLECQGFDIPGERPHDKDVFTVPGDIVPKDYVELDARAEKALAMDYYGIPWWPILVAVFFVLLAALALVFVL